MEDEIFIAYLERYIKPENDEQWEEQMQGKEFHQDSFHYKVFSIAYSQEKLIEKVNRSVIESTIVSSVVVLSLIALFIFLLTGGAE